MNMFDPTYLYSKTEDVDFNSDKIDEIISFMKLIVTKNKALGLAANQVGYNKSIFLFGSPKLGYSVAVNPKIVKYYDGEDILMQEGCLSFPGIVLNVRRPSKIEVEYYDENMNLIKENFSGMTARVFQHEYDHLMGKTFDTRVAKLSLKLALSKARKIGYKYVMKDFERE